MDIFFIMWMLKVYGSMQISRLPFHNTFYVLEMESKVPKAKAVRDKKIYSFKTRNNQYLNSHECVLS